MKNKHQKLLSWYKAKGCTLNLKINLDRLFKRQKKEKSLMQNRQTPAIAFCSKSHLDIPRHE